MANLGRFKYGLFLFVVVLALPVVFFSFILEETPNVFEAKTAAVSDAVRTRELAKKTIQAYFHHGQEVTLLTVSEGELNSLLAFMTRGVDRLTGTVDVSNQDVEAAVSLRLPHNPIGDYLNFRFNIVPAEDGLRVSQASLGEIDLPGPVALWLGRHLFDIALGEDIGTLAVNSVQAVSINGQQVTAQIQSIPGLKGRLDKIKRRFKFMRDKVTPLGDPLLVRIYYQELIELDQEFPIGEAVSLARFIEPLFALALARGGDPSEENQAAVLALTMFWGSERIGNFIGPVKTANMEGYQRRKRKVGLAGRQDLRLHFLISAGLKMVSDRGITHAIGEFKELLDAGRGGSGFSFIDLAADRAGVHFADAVVADSGSGERMQRVLSHDLEETMFFPDVAGLPEGLTQAEFRRFYGDVESNEYRVLVQAIDRCISRLPAFHDQAEEGAKAGDCRVSESIPTQVKEYLTAKADRAEKRRQARKPLSRPKPVISKQTELPFNEKPPVSAIAPRPLPAQHLEEQEEQPIVVPTPREDPQIERLEARLITMLQIYTEEHPEVIALRRRLSDLRQEIREPLGASPESDLMNNQN